MFGRIASTILLALVMLSTSTMADGASPHEFGMPEDGIYYSERTGRPLYVLTEALNSMSTKGIPERFPEKNRQLLQEFLLFVVEAEESAPSALSDTNQEWPEVPGCEIMTRMVTSHGPPNTWDEIDESLHDAAVVFVVQVKEQTPALLASIPRVALDLIGAEIVDVLKGGASNKAVGDSVVFTRRGGPVQILGRQYCEVPSATQAQFEVGDRVLMMGWESCDTEDTLWCGADTFRIVDGTVLSAYGDAFRPILLTSIYATLSTDTPFDEAE